MSAHCEIKTELKNDTIEHKMKTETLYKSSYLFNPHSLIPLARLLLFEELNFKSEQMEGFLVLPQYTRIHTDIHNHRSHNANPPNSYWLLLTISILKRI